MAEHEHITQAAEKLFISQPAVSKTIQRLEQEVGLALIDHQGRRILLTDAGHLLYQHARHLFALEEEMEQALASLRGGELGQIALGASRTTGIYLLPPVVAQFQKRYPRVELQITILNSQDIITQLKNWNLDFALVEGDSSTLPHPLHGERLGSDDLILVVAKDHHFASYTHPIKPEELCEDILLLREPGSGTREVIEHAFFHQEMELHPLLTLPDNEAIKQLVLNGMGAAIVSRLLVKRELEIGELKQIPFVSLDLQRQFSLVYRTNKQLSKAGQVFCDLLRQFAYAHLEATSNQNIATLGHESS